MKTIDEQLARILELDQIAKQGHKTEEASFQALHEFRTFAPKAARALKIVAPFLAQDPEQSCSCFINKVYDPRKHSYACEYRQRKEILASITKELES